MAAPIWKVGPPGDLRGLICPEPDVVVTPERFGGIHQGLSGARTVDYTGSRMSYELELKYLTPDEFAWLESLYYRSVPGPFRMLSPLKKNRLTPESSLSKFHNGTKRGVLNESGVGARVWDWPSGLLVTGQATKWTNRASVSPIRWDDWSKTTVIPGETITGSVYLKASSTLSMSATVDFFDHSPLTVVSSLPIVGWNVTTSWQRFTITGVVPETGYQANMATWTGDTTAEVYVAAAQLESGPTATDWELGGGAPLVSLESIDVESPVYPYVNVTAKFLEV